MYRTMIAASALLVTSATFLMAARQPTSVASEMLCCERCENGCQCCADGVVSCEDCVCSHCACEICLTETSDVAPGGCNMVDSGAASDCCSSLCSETADGDVATVNTLSSCACGQCESACDCCSDPLEACEDCGCSECECTSCDLG